MDISLGAYSKNEYFSNKGENAKRSIGRKELHTILELLNEEIGYLEITSHLSVI